MSPRLEVRGVTKQFPGVLANDDVNLSVAPGEIHALLGENGAGKSTLVKIIYGILHPDSGAILWNGAPAVIDNPRAARRLGIGMVFQHFSLFEAMTVNENIALGMDHPGDMAALAARVRTVSSVYGLPLDPHRDVHSLSVGERQRIEIVRCLLQEPQLLIMDEPTSVLTPQEVVRLFETLRKIAGEGCSILYISHKLPEIKALCNRATILRGGRVVAESDPRVVTTAAMAQLMIGGELTTVERRAGGGLGPERMVVDGLDLPAEDLHGVNLRGIGFTVRAGEIFGIAGVAGNGQNELLQALSGERLAALPASIQVNGQAVGHLNAGRRRGHGVCVIPEERNGHGAVASMSLMENVVLSAHRRRNLLKLGFIKRAETRRFTERIVADYDVRTPGVATAAASLSGGNLQKFIVGREILQDPVVLIACQPTWGVDAGASARIHQALIDLAASGAAVIVISQDLDELLAISNRMAVLNGGVLSRALDTVRVTAEEIGLLMGGVHGKSGMVGDSYAP